MKVLVTGTSTFFSARIVQELGRQQADVTAADSLRFSAGKMSRFCRKRLLLPRLGSDPGQYLDRVLDTIRRDRYDLLLPTFEESLLLSEYRDEIHKNTRLLLPDFDTMLSVHCKPMLHERCLDWSVPSPVTYWPADTLQLKEIAATFRYPAVMKLPMSNNSVGRSICRDATELIREYGNLCGSSLTAAQERPMIQEFVDGDLICTLMYCDRGRKCGEVVYRSLRTVPDNGGTSAHRESIRHDRIEQLTEYLAAKTNWSGFLGFDFIVSRSTREPYLIDANPRANPGTNLGYMAGVNWTEIAMQLARGGHPDTVIARPGVRTRTVLLDIAWLLERLSAPRSESGRSPLRAYLRPAWKSDGRDLLSLREDWRATVALGVHGMSSLVSSMLRGLPIGRIALEDANYDFWTASQLVDRSNSEVRRRIIETPMMSKAA